MVTKHSLQEKVWYFYDSKVAECIFPTDHPMQPLRLELTQALLEALELSTELYYAPLTPATVEEMLKFHKQSYIMQLEKLSALNDYEMKMMDNESYSGLFKRTSRIPVIQNPHFGLDSDCPPISGMWSYITRSVGASLSAARALINGETKIAINWMGGMHHACASKASGFCYVNDIVLAIQILLQRFNRVLYVDIDVHHGDGVENAFYSDRRVVTLSLHQFGDGFFPGTGEGSNNGPRNARGYTVNIPLRTNTQSHTFTSIFDLSFDQLIRAFDPEVLVFQCGADSIAGDRLGGLNVSTSAHAACLNRAMLTSLPILILGGGGYTPSNVARCWAIETAVALRKDTHSELPSYIPVDKMNRKYSEFFCNKIKIHPSTPTKDISSKRKRTAPSFNMEGSCVPLALHISESQANVSKQNYSSKVAIDVFRQQMKATISILNLSLSYIRKDRCGISSRLNHCPSTNASLARTMLSILIHQVANTVEIQKELQKSEFPTFYFRSELQKYLKTRKFDSEE